MLLRRIAITPRAVIGFAILASLLVALGLFAHNRMGSLNRAAKDIGEVWLPSVEASAQLSGLMSELRLGEMNHVLLHDATRMRQQEQRMDEVIATLARVEREYRPLLVLDEGARCSTSSSSASRNTSKDTPPCSRGPVTTVPTKPAC